MGMIEVIIDDSLIEGEQYVHDWGELTMPASDNDNFGPINLGGGDKYLLAIYDKFSKINVYTMCNYNQVITSIGSRDCEDLELG